VPNELGRVLQALRQEQQQWRKLYLATLDLNEAELRAALQSPSAERRFVAAHVVGDRRLMWTKELIGLLTDPVPAVRQAARRSLVILSFLTLNPEEASLIASPKPASPPKRLSELVKPVDFGPTPRANRKAQTAAAQKWTGWWEDQKSHKVMAVATLPGGHDELAAALLKAEGQQRETLIRQYQETKGGQYTAALATAAAQLTGDDRRDVRAALAERMARMTEATLGRYLEDDSAEVRRAAALGVAMRDSKSHLPRMIDMLDDPDPAVVRAVVAALRSLSGKDFGPQLNATQEEREEAVAKWKDWANGLTTGQSR
jgi:hypothetical protein